MLFVHSTTTVKQFQFWGKMSEEAGVRGRGQNVRSRSAAHHWRRREVAIKYSRETGVNT